MASMRDADLSDRNHLHVALDVLVRAGWVERWSVAGEKVIVEWTATGHERCQWLRTFETELKLNLKALETAYAMYAICIALGPKL